MNTNYKTVFRQKYLNPSAQSYQYPPYIPQPYIPALYPQCGGYPVPSPAQPYPVYPPVMHQQTIDRKCITNEDKEFIIDPTNTTLNAYDCELTDKHICSIDFNDARFEPNTKLYQYNAGILTITAYINKDGSIDFVLRRPSDDDDLEYYDCPEGETVELSNSDLYKKTFTTDEVKSVGNHCMEKLLCAFMTDAIEDLTAQIENK